MELELLFGEYVFISTNDDIVFLKLIFGEREHMLIKSVIKDVKQSIRLSTFNTGTLFDLATGNFLPGKNNSMILNGGIFLTNAVTGRPQMYKSGESIGYFTRVLRNYTQAEGLCYETELTLQGMKRIIELSGDLNDTSGISSRCSYLDKTQLSIEELYEMIKNMAKEKAKNKKDYIAETPFIDMDGNFIKSWIPTFIMIDSFSAATSSKENTLFDENNVGDSKTNMINVYDGKIKTDFCRQIPYICGSHGIYIISTAHIGNNTKLDPYTPATKDLPMMKSNDKLKNVGTQYSFLAVNMLETRKVEPLLDSKKKCLFPTDKCSSDMELQRITNVITRCKNNISGDPFDHVCSQYFGIQEYLDYYLFILENSSNLIEGRDHQHMFIHDQEFNRKNVRKYIDEDHTFRRALEILAHFAFVRNRYNIPEIKSMGYVEFCKKFNSSKELKEEMLNSTGVWKFNNDKSSNKKYMSIYDIVNKIKNL